MRFTIRSRKLVAGVIGATALLAYLTVKTTQGDLDISPARFISHDDGYYHWPATNTSFAQPEGSIPAASRRALCRAFPQEKLQEIQPVLKTGHGVIERAAHSLRGTSACLENLLIFSDHDETIKGRRVIDVIAEIPAQLLHQEAAVNQTRAYFALNGAVDQSIEEPAGPVSEGWKMDKFKFLAAIPSMWQIMPEKEWYVFYEGDTYIVWDTVFRLLERFQPDDAHYFGSPSPGREDVWFANGGPGFIISRGAMRKLIAHDWDHQSGVWIGNAFLEETWSDLLADCCGDSVLGFALHERKVELEGLWPLFNPHPLHGIPFSDLYWCQPVLSLHKSDFNESARFWRWEWSERAVHPERPILYRDIATSFFDFETLTEYRHDWDNGDWDAYDPNDDDPNSPHASIDSCRNACEMAVECLQWRYHLRQCTFVRSIRMGRVRAPDSIANFPDGDWNDEDLTYVSGWDTSKIKRWIEDRPCSDVQWVKPSTERTF